MSETDPTRAPSPEPAGIPGAETAPAASLRVAAIQMVSAPSVDPNLEAAARLIAQAAADGARVVVLPEYFCLLGERDTDKVAIREADGQGPIQEFLAAQAALHRIWLVGGTVPLACARPAKVRNACLAYAPDGSRRARYDKIHLFGFHRGDEKFDEASTIDPGRTPVVLDADGWRIGLSVCYDLRFPELYRALSPADLILVPSAFTYTTGRAHWETLLKTRAIENQCYVLAPAQGGRHPNGRRTWGHSMLVDPWGEVLAVRDEGEAVVAGTIERERIGQVRTMLPALGHRVM